MSLGGSHQQRQRVFHGLPKAPTTIQLMVFTEEPLFAN